MIEEEAKRSASGSEIAVMEFSTSSSRFSKEEDEKEKQGPEESSTSTEEDEPSLSSLTSAEASSFASGSTLRSSDGAGASGSGGGGGGNDDVEVIGKEHMFDMVVTPSDVGKLNRLVIPKQHAEKYFPLDTAANEKGLLFSFEDRTGKPWRFRYSYWNSSQSYVMTKGWSRFVKEKRLNAGDTVSFCRGTGEAARHRLFIDWKRSADVRNKNCLPRLSLPMASAYFMPPAPPATLYEHHRLRQGLDFCNINAAAPARQLLFFGSANMPPRGPMLPPPPPPPPMHITVQPSPAVTAGLPMVLDSVPLVNSPTAAAKRVRLFGVNLDNLQPGGGESGHDTNALSLRMPGWQRPTKVVRRQRLDQNARSSTFTEEDSFDPKHAYFDSRASGSYTGSLLAAEMHRGAGGELLMSQYHNTVERPWEKLKRCLDVVKFVVRIKARVRCHQARKQYTTHGSATADELGVTADRLLTKGTSKGTGLGGCSYPEAWTKDLESDASEVTKVVRRQRLDDNVRSSTFTEEDSFYPRHKYLYIKERVEQPHFTFHKDVKAWIAIKKQYGGGLHHTCMQQVGPKLLGRNDIKQMIMKKILLDRYGGSNYTVICINAGSGHGKTSLLRVLYNDQQLMDAFDKRIWIQMSDKLDILMLFRKIVEFTMNDHCSITNLRYLQEMVEEEITDKKLVLFLDDADIEDQQFWNSVLEVLNAGARGSVVVMATRSATVAALRGVAIHSYFLSPLSEENNLKLLQQYAVVGTDIQSNPDLVMVAKRFISRFGANPLNLKAIGGLLCHTDTTSLENDKFEGSAMPLQLCHDLLPIRLKKCLAFCSLFPEGYIFDRYHIVLLWISHGCIRPVEGCELEDVGAEYFNDLLCRSFFQYSPFHSDKDEKFVMHELIYKVVQSVSRNRYFKSEDLMSSVPENILHLSLVSSQFQTVQLMPKTENLKDLQTFLVVQPEWQQYKISFPALNLVGLDDFFLKFTSLATLDLSHVDIEELPGSISSMRNLQYLSLNNTSIRVLSSEFCSLNNLQTLEAKDCRFLTELPGDTKKLLKLRHLDVTKELGYVHLPHGVGQLIELRTLPVFHASGDSSHCCISELGSLHNLRGCLRLSGLETVKTGSKAQEVNLMDKQHLQDLTLQWHDGGADIDDDDADDAAEQVLESLQPHANLQELTIRGYEGSAFPAWMQGSFSLPNLVSLTLDSCCNCAQFPAIAQLPSLKFLSVRKMYDVQRLSNNINVGTKFPSLELLNLWEMYGLKELFEASEGDCPRLRKVCINRCPDLKRLPCIPSVTELVLHCCHQLPDIPELASLASLKIEGFHSAKSFSLPPDALPVLKKLEIRSCNELSWVHGLAAMTTVQRLKIARCPKLVLPRNSSLTT